ncbi:MAG: ABC transporter permease [Candidatus Saccharicenans sp.]
MSPFRLLTVIKKEFLHIRRDPIYLTLLLILPSFILILYGYALNFDVKHLPLAVVDYDQSQYSRQVVEKVTASEYFDLKYNLKDSREIDPLLNLDLIRLAIVIPVDFSRTILAGRTPEIQIIIDGSNSSSASTGLGYLNAILQQYNIDLNLSIMERAGLSGESLPLENRSRVWYNPELKSSKFLVPGLMAFILMIIIVLATSLSIVREKEKGTMEQLLLSPLRPPELILGKIIPYLILSLIGAHLVLLTGWLLFGVAIKGNYFLLLLILLLFLFCGLSQGLLISAVANSQQVAFMMAGLSTLLPTFVLSGFVFPIQNMPHLIQLVTYIIPARYFLVGLRSIILKGVGIKAFYADVLFLMNYALIMSLISWRRLSQSLSR